MNQHLNKFKIVVASLSLVAFIACLVSTILYAANCASEFNGNQPSEIVIGWGIAAIIVSGITFVGHLASVLINKGEKVEYCLSLVRIGNYATFACLLGNFLFGILEEYSLLGTVLYPIVSGTVGDPVDSTLSFCYFTSLILSFVAMIIALVVGILVKKRSIRDSQNGVAKESEVK